MDNVLWRLDYLNYGFLRGIQVYLLGFVGFRSVLPGCPLNLVSYFDLAAPYSLDRYLPTPGLVFLALASLIAGACYPVLVSQAFEDGQVRLKQAFKEAVGRLWNVLLYVFVMTLILIALGLLAIPILFVFLRSAELGYLLLFAYLLFCAYLVLRFFLVIPTLLVEQNNGKKQGLVDSFSVGFDYTGGNVLSILAAVIMISLVTLPLHLLNIYVSMNFYLQIEWWISELQFGQAYWLRALWEGFAGVFGVLAGILPTMYYYAAVKHRKASFSRTRDPLIGARLNEVSAR